MGLSMMESHTVREELGAEIRTRVTALLDVLDEDIRHVEATLMRLDMLRGLLIRRDDGALEKLLEEIRREQEAYAATERRRGEIRRDLAAGLGCGEGDLTLSRLLAHLARDDRTAVAERQTRLKTLIGRLRREHTLTTLLIADCGKFNRLLMRTVFGLGDDSVTTYSASGLARTHNDAALVSLHF